MLGQAEFLVGAEHTAGLHAAELSLGDVDAAGKIGVVLRDRDQIASMDVLCAGDDLDGLAAAHINHADPHVVGVFMPRHRKHLADDYIFDFRVHTGDGLDLLAGDGHDLVIFFVRGGDVHEVTEPFSRNVHSLFLLLRTATGSGRRFQRSCAGR